MSRYLSFHQGELAVQAMANESAIAQRNGRVLSDRILPGAIPFIAQQNMLVVSSIDESGQPWSSILFGQQGFIQATSHNSLLLDTRNMLVNEDDPLWQNIVNNKQVGILAIELSTRRRFRVNGRIVQVKESTLGETLAHKQFEIKVQQAYPNCPKFIQRRNLKLDPKAFSETLPAASFGTALNQDQQCIIKQTDSFFVSSCSLFKNDELLTEEYSVDASYRGGLPGFIKVLENNTLLIPDYQGNSMFNTLGNIHLNPKAGIIIVDFEHSRVLQLSGCAKILWQQEDNADHSAGTKRFWQLSVEKWQETLIPKGINWSFQDYSPHNPRALKLKEAGLISHRENEKIALGIRRVINKSPRIKQYQLVAQAGDELPSFEAGAHLPIEVKLGNGETLLRHYSILSSPLNKGGYEIAVQKEEVGRGGSKAIHESFQLGSVVQAFPPRSEFTLKQDDHHKVLIAGGIGITPMLSMLRQLSETGVSFEFHYAARSDADLAFKEEVLALAGEYAFFYVSEGVQAHRLDILALIQASKPHSHIYICGPLSLINSVRELTKAQGWEDSRVHYESFGNANQMGNKAIEVRLKKSNQVITVDPKQSILEALNDNNVTLPFDCKRGECGMCATTLLEGEVDHRDFYLSKAEQKHQICVCVSRAKGETLTLDL